jgi:hypothetical protein
MQNYKDYLNGGRTNMLNLIQLQINVTTADGFFGANIPFSKGLNIIRGDNTSGKSTALECILYCLGIEELLGGKNEKTMQSVLKDELEEGNKKLPVTESLITLEISNGVKSIGIVRAVRSQTRDPRLVEVVMGPLLSEKYNNFKSEFMYLHDAGAATDTTFGFHAFLSEFIGYKLPQVELFSGGETKLYLQCLFPSFFIEQKAGWSDFLATVPTYGIRGVKSRSVEFILSLDVIENIRKKQEISQKKAEKLGEWHSIVNSIVATARSINGHVKGIEKHPTTIKPTEKAQILILQNGKEYSIGDYIGELQTTLVKLQSLPVETAGQVVEKQTGNLEQLLEEINTKRFGHDRIMTEISDETTRVASLHKQLDVLNSDLRKNKSARKVEEYGAQLKMAVATKACPTCQQTVKDFLLPQDMEQTPLGIDQNISFLEEQKKMILTYVNGLKASIEQKKLLLSTTRADIDETSKQVRALRDDMVAPTLQPSEADIEKRIELRKKVTELTMAEEKISEQLNMLSILAADWTAIIGEEAKLPKEYFSDLDKKKLDYLSKQFKSALTSFGYKSKSLEYVSLSTDTYLPSVASIIDISKKDYDIRFDSSASDFIRSIWAYTCSLFECSKETGGNHPYLIVIDEPAQHSMSNQSLASLLERLEHYSEAQVVVAASFNNSDSDFNETTANRDFTLYKIADRLITRKK